MADPYIDPMRDDFAELNLEDEEPGLSAFVEQAPGFGSAKSATEVVHLLDSGKTEWDSLDHVDKLALAYLDGKNKGRPTFLHKLAHNWAMDEFRELRKEERKKIVLFLLDNAVRHMNNQWDPILSVAIEYHTTDFIDFVIQWRPEMLRTLLVSTDVKGMNCLHKAFKDTLIQAFKERNPRKKREDLALVMATTAKLLDHAQPDSVAARDDFGNTPIHYAMDYRLCHLDGEYKHEGQEHTYEGIIRSLLTKAEPAMKTPGVLFNNRHHSPYRYYYFVKSGIETNSQIRKEKAQKLLEEEAKAKSKAKENSKDDRRDLKRNAGKPLIGESNSRKWTAPTPREEPSQPQSFDSYIPNPSVTWAAQRQARDPSLAPTTAEKEQNLSDTEFGPPTRKLTNTMNPASDGAHSKGPEATRRARTPKPDGTRSANMLGSLWPRQEGKEAAESILGFLKCFLIRHSSDRTAKDLLFGKIASDKNLFFDASHLRGRKVDDVVKLIDKVSRAGGFEDTLSYVRIPHLVSDTLGRAQRQNVANEKRMKKGTGEKEPSGRDTLVKVFDKLVEVNVRRILRLHVEDNVDEWAHTDTAIEQAIRGYNKYAGGIARSASLAIEEWDWCKPDINLDVVKYAVPTVEHIHLHWSGHQTTLYGWASTDNGIPQMYRDKRSLLTDITLHAYQGLEGSIRRQAMIDHFRALIDERTKGGVRVTPKLSSSSAVVSARSDGEGDSLLGEQYEQPRADAWIEAMETFRRAMLGLHRIKQPSELQRVKVALIDDGIDLDNINDYGFAEYTGVSYCSGSGRDEDAWWKSTGGHGTIMANMISRINPWVTLDVIKIHSGPSFMHGGARSISPRSAADAIDAAVMHNADIISASWTITDLEYRMSRTSDSTPDADGNKKRADESELQLLRNAIAKAVKDDQRLLICAAADDVRLIGDNTLPYSEAPGQILRIGSAGVSANRDPGSGSATSITYYLPGEKVAEDQRAHSVKKIVYHNGSSVSTALAAGLASLIMYCCYFLHASEPDDKYLDWARALRNHTNMRKVFSSINRYFNWAEDPKYLPVWGIFGDKGRQLEKASSREEKLKVLESLVTYLCGDVNERKQSLG